jgi:hypothetical protein
MAKIFKGGLTVVANCESEINGLKKLYKYSVRIRELVDHWAKRIAKQGECDTDKCRYI